MPRSLPCLLVAAGLSMSGPLQAQILLPPFDDDYHAVDLGSVPGVPVNYGGVEFLTGNPDVLLIGGAANQPSGKIYAVDLLRDAAGRITGYAGAATEFASSPHIDGGLDFHRNSGVLFATRYPLAELSQLLPGSTSPDKIVDLAALGMNGSAGGLQFVPPSFPGSGSLKIASYNTSEWYSAVLAADAQGTYDVVSLTLEAALGGGIEGIAFVPPGSPEFADFRSVLVSEFDTGRIVAYELDDDGDPLPATRREFLTDVQGAEGGTVDPVTGDFLFTTFTGGNRVVKVSGFVPPCEDDAFWARYGAGWPGTHGVPSMGLDRPPVINEDVMFHLDNSRGSSTFSIIIVGFAPVDIPTNKGGSILVIHDFVLPFSLAPSGLDLPFRIPDVPEFCGLDVYVQALELDPGASHGISFTDGLRMHFGS